MKKGDAKSKSHEVKTVKLFSLKKKKETKFEKDYKQEFIKTYVKSFDALIGEGIPKGSAILVEGGPGSGKTIFCLEVLKNACERGKRVLYMSFEEPEQRLIGHLRSFGAKPDEYIKEGILMVKRFNALDIARSVEALLSEAKKELLIDVQPVLIPMDFKPDIVLIDSLSSIASAFSGEESRFRIYMEQLFRYLEGHDMTSFLIREVSSPSHVGTNFVEQGEAVSFLSDGIIAMYNVFYKGGKRKRAVEVVKMRGTDIDRRIVEFDIVKGKGFVISGNTLKGDYILT
jgi:circadian clock protein KaiC